MEQQGDRPGADQGTREIDRGTAGDDGGETTPIRDPDDAPIAPGLELAGGVRAAQDLRRAANVQRWRSRPPCRATVNRNGGRSVLAAIDASASSRLAR